MLRVLRLPRNEPLVWQRALLTKEASGGAPARRTAWLWCSAGRRLEQLVLAALACLPTRTVQHVSL